MTRDGLEQYLLWSGFFDISRDNLLKIIEIIIGEKLITEVPKPSIREQLKDCKMGDFITLRHIKKGVIKVIMKRLDEDILHSLYIGTIDDNTMFMGYLMDDIQEIIKIQHNNF